MIRRFILLASAIMWVGGCHEPDATDSASDVSAEDSTTADSGANDATGKDAGTVDTGPPGPVTRLTVIDDLLFTTSSGGEAVGFDLDNVVSDGSEESTCYNADFTSPDGVEGVDNKLATLVPFFEAFGIGAAQGLIQDAIETGGILLMLQVDGIDDPLNDDDVTVTVRAGFGLPLLGTDGKLLAGQTFSIHEDTADSQGSGRLVDGVLHAGPLEVEIPIVIFGIRYDLTFLETQLIATWTEDGGLKTGMLGGSVRIPDLITIGEIAAADDGSVLTAIQGLLGTAGDSAPDEEGVCQQISGTFTFSAVSAFLYPEESAGK
ncbi:MAG: hypothetical protein ACI9OJ_005044 [Myxococcota bacterium]